MNDAFDIIENMRLTEKGTLLSEQLNQYVFRVKPHANKLQIKRGHRAALRQDRPLA